MLVIAEMQARELLRRRAVMTLFVLLPAAFYYSVPAGEDYSLLAGSMGVSWAVAAAGVFSVLGWRRADPRLALTGAPVRDGMIGRLLLLQGLGLLLVAAFAPQILWRSDALLTRPAAMVLALVCMAAVSVPLGLAIGSLVGRELEATLVLIGIVGVGTSVPPDSALAQWLPLWGPLEIVQVAAGRIEGSITGGLVHTVVTTAVLLAAAWWSWHRRNRIHIEGERS